MTTLDGVKDKHYISGKELLLNEAKYENKNELDTLAFIYNSGKHNLKEQFDGIGSALSLLSQLASCAWGCSGGTHLKENLIRRFANYCFATIRLNNLGFYNEALALIRSGGELANLIALFSSERGEFEEWSAITSSERWDKFKPEKIRAKLNEFSIPEIMSHETYSELCGISIHPSIEFALMSHQENGNVFIGSEFSRDAIISIYNELTSILSKILTCISAFMAVDIELDKTLQEVSLTIASRIDTQKSLVTYLHEIEKDDFAELAIDSVKVDDFLLALSKYAVFFVLVDKPKKLAENVNKFGSITVTAFSTKYDNQDIIPIFTSERKAKRYISSLDPEDQKKCREFKLIIKPLLAANHDASFILNFGTNYQRKITSEELAKLRKLVEIDS